MLWGTPPGDRAPRARPGVSDESPTPQLDALLDYLKRARGFDLAGYKRPGLIRRIERRMQLVGSADLAAYMELLEENPDEFSQLFNTVLINVTSFFRDEHTWECIVGQVVPQLIADTPSGDPIRVWSAGCASGQEAYTLAMIFAEALGREPLAERVEIHATDIDEDALATARAGVYAEREMDGVPGALRERYFTRAGTRFAVREDLRRAVTFGRNDLVHDAPISRIGLLVCRNTLMYFDGRAQAQMLSRFHCALNDGGYLFLGRAETLLTHWDAFAPVDLRGRIFMKRPAATPSAGVDLN